MAMRFVILLTLAVTVQAALDRTRELQEWYTALISLPSPQTDGPDRGEAFRNLVLAGEDGWKLIFDAEFIHLDHSGDKAREISSFWNTTGVDEKLLERFLSAEAEEKRKRATNETWALLYASAYEDSKSSKLDRHMNDAEILQRLIDGVIDSKSGQTDLLSVARLRVRFVSQTDFPGHRFPWHGTSKEQSDASRDIRIWWASHRKEFESE